jgi:hypothetical protein
MPNDADRQVAIAIVLRDFKGAVAATPTFAADVERVAKMIETHRLAAYQAGQRDMQSATGPMWETLATIAATSDCEASRKAAAEAMAEVEPVLDAILALPVKETPDGAV